MAPEVQWKHASEIFGRGYSVIINGISLNDIFQGRLNNSYFLSSISAICERPNRIYRILLTQSYSHEGIYAIALNYCRVWRKVHIDSYFPTAFSDHLYCARTPDAELWVMILEKAYAKLHKGYWNIGHSGFAHNALKDLTGAPAEEIDMTEDKEELWSSLMEADGNDYIMVTRTKKRSEDVKGLVGGHDYTLIGVHVINGEKVVELRNPYGEGEWEGPWGDEGSKWTSNLKNKYHPGGARDDGRFFMSYDNYLKYYESLSFCYYENDFILSSFYDELEEEVVGCYQASVGAAGDYYVCLSQEDANAFYDPEYKDERKFERFFTQNSFRNVKNLEFKIFHHFKNCLFFQENQKIWRD